ncbi:MAG TPA: transposase, partial [Paenibacillus sp.]|nr:transposase [Paenibacillus sp.]
FADMKEKHGMRWTTLRGLRKVSMQAMLVYACMNLKKLATWLWRSGGSKRRFAALLLLVAHKQDKLLGSVPEQRRLSAI